MSGIVQIALLGWFLVVPAFFLLLPPRRAVLAAFLVAWLFLPVGALQLSGLPNVDKMWMTSMGTLLGVLIFDAGRLFSFRPRWYDIFIVALCCSPLLSSISNGLGVYDGLSNSFEKSVNWGLPYFFGRIYFNNLTALRELAIGILIGGLLYVPLALYEVRMSPQLHNLVYGYFPHVWAQTKRFDGWRPQVFMPHGLALGFWMASATLIAIWLWVSKSKIRLARVHIGFAAAALLLTTFLAKSVNGWMLLAMGLTVMGCIALRRLPLPRRLVLVGVIAIAPTYMALRTTSLWQGEVVVPAVATLIHPNRARSLEYRLEAEELLVDRAMERPLLGWGGWGRHRVVSEEGYDLATTDGQWIIQFGKHGFFGLIAWAGVLLIPPLLVARRLPSSTWRHPLVAPTIALATIVSLYAVDSLLNAMPNPLFVLTTGGLAACALTARDRLVIAGVRPIHNGRQRAAAKPAAAGAGSGRDARGLGKLPLVSTAGDVGSVRTSDTDRHATAPSVARTFGPRRLRPARPATSRLASSNLPTMTSNQLTASGQPRGWQRRIGNGTDSGMSEPIGGNDRTISSLADADAASIIGSEAARAAFRARRAELLRKEAAAVASASAGSEASTSSLPANDTRFTKASAPGPEHQPHPDRDASKGPNAS
ncbi:MAG: O-antigen ligase family protein [Planctomycetota bacterium]